MKRAPIVLTGTACGLVAVIGYHTASPQASTLAGSSSSTGTSSLTVGAVGAGGSGGSSAKTASTAKTASASSSSAASVASRTRSAAGSDIQYQFGDIEVKVTMSGTRITDVSVVKADVYDARSQEIDQYALPQLRSQALQAQSAKIDGVSGASYTSAAYEQSLQSAIDKLKA